MRRRSTRFSIAAGCRPGRRCWCSARPAASGWPRSSSARRKGARVIAAVSSEEKAAAARDGRRRRGDRLSAGSVRQGRAEGAGAAVQGGGRTRRRRRHLRPGRRRLCRGGAAQHRLGGPLSWSSDFPAGIPRLPLNLTLLKSCDVCGVFWGAFAARDPKANAAHVDELFRLWDEGKIWPKVSAHLSARAGRRGDRGDGRAPGHRQAGRDARLGSELDSDLGRDLAIGRHKAGPKHIDAENRTGGIAT